MAIKPRWYQQEAVDAVGNFLHNENSHGLVVIPTGGGKTWIYTNTVGAQLKEIPDLRVGIISHQKELLEQGFTTLMNYNNTLDVGIYSAGMGQRKHSNQIMLMGIQSVHNKVDLLGDFDMLLVDECHLMPRSADTMYGRFIMDMQERVNHLRVIGLTATPYRLDSGSLIGGDDAIFDKLIYEVGVGTLIQQGYLCPLITKPTDTIIDTSGVKSSKGDFIQKSLDEAVDKDEVTKPAVAEVVHFIKEEGRKKTLLFCTSVNHAQHVAAEMVQQGVRCEVLTGDTPAGQRSAILRDFKSGLVPAIANVGVLTTGFDEPGVDLIALFRGTKSRGLYQQMCGRGLRPLYPAGFNQNACTHEERFDAIQSGPKPNCRVLDFAQNIRRHGPIDDIYDGGSGPKPRGGGEEFEAPLRQCPECRTLQAVARMECIECGFQFDPETHGTIHDTTATNLPIMKTLDKRDTFWTNVLSSTYMVHHKMGRPDSLRVNFETEDFGTVATFFSFESEYRKAKEECKRFWDKVHGGPVPNTASEAMEFLPELVDISCVAVKKDGKYHRVMAYTAGDSLNGSYKKCSCGTTSRISDPCVGCSGDWKKSGGPVPTWNNEWDYELDDEIPF